MNSLELVIQVGALAIPGVGEAIDGGMSMPYSNFMQATVS